MTETPVPTFPVRKTVYLIRHAESDENRRQRSLGRSLGSVRRLALPTREDLAASLELVDVQAQIAVYDTVRLVHSGVCVCDCAWLAGWW